MKLLAEHALLHAAEKEKKKRSTAELLPVLFFDPYHVDHPQSEKINFTSNAIAEYLDGIEGIADLKEIRTLVQPLEDLIGDAYESGFDTGSKHSKKALTAVRRKKMRLAARKRAKEVVAMMKKTTKKGLKSDSDYVLSSERADKAAKYEAGLAYFKGVKDAFSGVAGWGKAWTTAHNPCDECIDAEDEGPIPFDEAFENGLYGPPLHLNCLCSLTIQRME
jgi:hypothetical protein